MRTTGRILTLLALMALHHGVQAQVLFSDDFTVAEPFIQNATVVNPDVWHSANTNRFNLDADNDSARRTLGSPAAYTAMTIGFTPADPVDADLVFSFEYDMDITDAVIGYAIYGAESTFGGGGGARLRTDRLEEPGSNWKILAIETNVTVSGTGTVNLPWTFDGTNYAHIGVQIATISLNTGGGSYFDITEVTVTQGGLPPATEPSAGSVAVDGEQFVITWNDLDTAISYVLQATEDATDPEGWQNVGAPFTPASETDTTTDTDAHLYPVRIYRLFAEP